ncbi:hypothetical protein GOARA_029_00210 [Gordonia araii NBRC 100433]|uniref:Uncharacterized protein n=1 Tax=Gordonia araii NBRC 100433 TaxID=1073574 RepID=G7GZY2_9ACTN|nr:hypothetical protein [Gordonia araii]NNG99168.1 hypothetical protein [Gordonia araii NBRC 100433]GAB09157.1 hypothetical protein GOARA_029_00210 [Gordonia araii NBRC 100433]
MNSNISPDEEKEKVFAILLIEGLDDWVPIDSAFNAVHYVTGSSNGASLTVRPVLHRIVDEGLAVVGTVDEGFHPWPGGNAEVLNRMDRFIEQHPNGLDPSYEFCFELTPKGRELAATIPDPFADDPVW